MMHGWYKALDAAIPSASFKASIVKLCLDQSIAAPTLIASFFVVVGVLHYAHSFYSPRYVDANARVRVVCVVCAGMKAMEGKSRAELEEKMRRDYLATMKVNWSVWPLISFINFRFIPPAQRYFPPTTALAGGVCVSWCCVCVVCRVCHARASCDLFCLLLTTTHCTTQQTHNTGFSAVRVLYVSCVSVLWNAYLSWVNAR
jgi:hypothetical protein